jgi:transcriptional regulator with XRE-family HTH domain
MKYRLHRYWRSEVAVRLRLARRNAGLTQPQLAAKAGLSLDTIQSVEQHRRVPCLATVLLWCANTTVSTELVMSGLY